MRPAYETAAEDMMRLDRDPAFHASFRKSLQAFKRRFGGEDCGRTALPRIDWPARIVVTDWVTHRVAEFDTSGPRLRFIGAHFNR